MLDVCLISNLVTSSVASLAVQPLPGLVAAGVSCSLSTDDPAMFGIDLTKEYEAAVSLGVDPERLYWAGGLPVPGSLAFGGAAVTPKRATQVGVGHVPVAEASSVGQTVWTWPFRICTTSTLWNVF